MKVKSNVFVRFFSILLCIILVEAGLGKDGANQHTLAESGLRVSTFDIDVTPPVGYQMAYQPVLNVWDLGLRARGIVLLGAGQPVVLLAIDWIGISNGSQDEFKRAIADAAGTTPERVAVHALHQHDAPTSDFSTEKIMKQAGLDPLGFDGNFAREVIRKLAIAVRQSLDQSRPITHLGLGEAEVYKVASNRRILGKDGRVRAGRMSYCKDPEIISEPEGTIDPMVSVVSFWNNDKPVAVLSYYATHPQSYYLSNVPNPDFPGIARFNRQLDVPEALHVHFTGAAGNVAAGKYNDGSKENRGILAERLADGMKRAWASTKRESITAESVGWRIEAVALPPAQPIKDLLPDMKAKMNDTTFLMTKPLGRNARLLAWLQRCEEGKKIDVSCLTLGRARVLHLPGELFVEYQLAAKARRPDLFVAMAAYGDGGPGYIGTEEAYEQGGYEITVSNVSPETEDILMTAINKLLQDE